MKPNNKNNIKCTEIHASPMSYFEDGSPVQFKININSTRNLTNRYYGEVVYYSPTSKSWVIIWFSHNYNSVPEAFEDCWQKQKDFMKDNPTMAC